MSSYDDALAAVAAEVAEAEALVARIAAEHAECYTIDGSHVFASADLWLTRRTAAQFADEMSGKNGPTGHVLIQFWLAGSIIHTEHVYGPRLLGPAGRSFDRFERQREELNLLAYEVESDPAEWEPLP